jgi:hypothetical protein
MSTIVRSALLAGAVILAALDPVSVSAQVVGSPRAGAPFSSVGVDVGLLRAQENGAASLLRDVLERELRESFASRIGGFGPRLVVRITGLSLNAFAGSDRGLGGASGSGTNTDYLEGEALLVGRRGEILERYPQLSAVPASSGGAYYLPGEESRRVIALAKHFAGWLQRRIP